MRGGQKYILFLGRLDVVQKGIDLLLEAYAKVAGSLDTPLVIAGNGPDEQKVKTLIKKHHLQKSVKMIGPTYGRKKMKVLKNSLFVAFPSRHEGFSLFSLEALAAGLPLVSFDIPGLSWVKRGTALKAKPFDVDGYARLLKRCADQRLAKKMGRNARAFAKNYTWDKVADQFEEFFIQVLRKEKR